MAQFACGEIVRLKSGGPWMTVRWADLQNNEYRVCCTWFTADGVMNDKVFEPDMLERKPANDQPAK